MILSLVLILALGIGIVAGLRSLTAPAVVAWAAYMGWLNLAQSPLAFMGSGWAVFVFTLAALFEFVGDLIPSTPARTAAIGLTARILMGLFSGACLGMAGRVPFWVAAALGGIGAIAGAFAGYHARVGLVRSLRTPILLSPYQRTSLRLGLDYCWFHDSGSAER
jgi:uncharacterized membrane protein